MDGKSLDIAEDKLEKLKEILPEAFTEGKIDLEKFRLTLGEDINIQDERYVLNWAGKSDAFRALQTPTTSTLTPARDEAVNFDSTKNIFVEGENLEVLKVLQKAYYGKIKLIYIDPPYNTGSDSFVYPDRFSESREEYLKRLNDKDEDGLLLREGLFRKNTKDSGHYHSNWLSMIYPRLFMARNLLSEAGSIVINIDDNEVHNLRLLMNEIFGEENFVACVVWFKKVSPSNDARYFSSDHDYLLVYAKNLEQWKLNRLPRTDEQKKYYKNLDNDPRGPWNSATYTSNKSKEERPNLYYPIVQPNTGKEIWPKETAVWAYSKELHEQHKKDNRIYWGKDGTATMPRFKLFLSEAKKVVPRSVWHYSDVGHTQEATREFQSYFPQGGFETPKPTRLLKRILQIGSLPDDHDIVLDFFAGSSSTAEAVFKLNEEDNGNRQFLMVQIAEETNKKDYPTIAEIGKERIKKAINKIKKENPMFAEDGLDLGFKVFKLKHSNFKLWRGDGIDNDQELEKQLDILKDPVRPGVIEENMLFELILKAGYPLTTKVEKDSVGNTHYFLVSDDLAIALHRINENLIKNVLARKTKQFICLDRLFNNNDQLKTNTQLQFKDAGIEFHSI